MQFDSVFTILIIMKILLTLFVLLFPSSVFADDISDFEIEGMSIGDSLLDYLNEQEILSEMSNKYIFPNSKIYFQTSYDMKSKNYERISFTLKENDNRYIIHSISGIITFKKNFDQCHKFKKEVIKDISFLFPKITPRNYDYIYKNVDDGKSISYISEGTLEGGIVRVYCTDWSKVAEENTGNIDLLNIELMTDENTNWLDSEAY